MKVFTYKQYVKYIHEVRLNEILQLAEDEEKYITEDDNQIHEKIVKNVLKDKKEVSMFINTFLEPKEKIENEKLLRYNNSYINKKYKFKEAELVYKLKDKEMFFLIEHQSIIDNQMSYRILNYCIDIMKEWNRNKKIRKNIVYPLIVPIVIYTGNRKWEISKKFKEKQVGNYIFERHNINLEYNLIDINKISKKFLLKKNNMFCNIMLLEKSKDKEELKNNLKDIIKITEDEYILNKLSNIIIYMFNKVLKNNEQEELIEKINKKLNI